MTFRRKFTRNAPGSVLVESGRTQVLCTASISDYVPQWLQGSNQGWLTAEYAMLPSSTQHRKPREGRNGRIDGRSQEIQRLIGRALRSVVDLKALPEVTIWVDCDVLQADGGTRTAAINGACIAVHDALTHLEGRGQLRSWPMNGLVSAMSVGLVGGETLVDLDYQEDSSADVDMNLVYLSDGRMVEVQGSAEGAPFSEQQFQELVAMARVGCDQVLPLQKQVLEQ